MSRQFLPLGGLAMLLVVLHHTIVMLETFEKELGLAAPSSTTWYIFFVLRSVGYFAVPTFLFISGSFFAYAAKGRDGKGLTYRIVLANVKNILWPYVIWSLVFYVVIYFQYGQSYSLFGYVVNLLVGYPFHFIPLLLFWYVVSPFLARLRLPHAVVVLILIACYQALLVVISEPDTYGVTVAEAMNLLIPPVLGPTLANWAIYFPLGFVFGRYPREVKPLLERWRPVLAVAALALFGLHLAESIFSLSAPWAHRVAPLCFALIIPVIPAGAIPFERTLARVGKRSYGLYLTHMILLDLMLLAIQHIDSRLLNHQLLLMPFLFVAAMLIPLAVMEYVVKSPASRRFYRYAFG